LNPEPRYPPSQATGGMGVSIGDYNRSGNLDIVKTNFAGDTDFLYTNLGDASSKIALIPADLASTPASRLGRGIPSTWTMTAGSTC